MADEAPNTEAAAAPPPAAKSGGGGMMPALLIIVLMPVISFAMFKFVFVPMIKAEMPANGAEHAEIKAEDVHVQHDGGDADFSYAFEPASANLKGTSQSRYILAKISVRSSNPDLEAIIGKNKDRMDDVVNGVLRNLTLADLEEPHIKNMVRNQLMQGFEHVLKGPIIEEVVIPGFVIQ